MIQRLLNRLTTRALGPLVGRTVRAELEAMTPLLPQLLEFGASSREERQPFHDLTYRPRESLETVREICDQLRGLGIAVEKAPIDLDDFRRWLDSFPELERHYRNCGETRIEKCLEHYLTYRHAQVASGDVLVDVAAAASPWAKILRRRGIRSFRLDRCYPTGERGIEIGADATATGLADGSVRTLTVHCAFETFQGSADSRFIVEARRILAPGGRCVIAPLYLDKLHFVATSPYCRQSDIEVDASARRLWRDDPWHEPFSRHYSAAAFAERVAAVAKDLLHTTVRFVDNLPALMDAYPDQRLYCYFVLVLERP